MLLAHCPPLELPRLFFRFATLRNSDSARIIVVHRAVLDVVERHDPIYARRAMIEHLSTFKKGPHGTSS